MALGASGCARPPAQHRACASRGSECARGSRRHEYWPDRGEVTDEPPHKVAAARGGRLPSSGVIPRSSGVPPASRMRAAAPRGGEMSTRRRRGGALLGERRGVLRFAAAARPRPRAARAARARAARRCLPVDRGGCAAAATAAGGGRSRETSGVIDVTPRRAVRRARARGRCARAGGGMRAEHRGARAAAPALAHHVVVAPARLHRVPAFLVLSSRAASPVSGVTCASLPAARRRANAVRVVRSLRRPRPSTSRQFSSWVRSSQFTLDVRPLARSSAALVANVSSRPRRPLPWSPPSTCGRQRATTARPRATRATRATRARRRRRRRRRPAPALGGLCAHCGALTRRPRRARALGARAPRARASACATRARAGALPAVDADERRELEALRAAPAAALRVAQSCSPPPCARRARALVGEARASPPRPLAADVARSVRPLGVVRAGASAVRPAVGDIRAQRADGRRRRGVRRRLGDGADRHRQVAPRRPGSCTAGPTPRARARGARSARRNARRHHLARSERAQRTSRARARLGLAHAAARSGARPSRWPTSARNCSSPISVGARTHGAAPRVAAAARTRPRVVAPRPRRGGRARPPWRRRPSSRARSPSRAPRARRRAPSRARLGRGSILPRRPESSTRRARRAREERGGGGGRGQLVRRGRGIGRSERGARSAARVSTGCRAPALAARAATHHETMSRSFS